MCISGAADQCSFDRLALPEEAGYASIEALAAAADLHPKVIRQGFRLAFLPPDLTAAALAGETTIELKQIPKRLPLSWLEQHRSIS